MHALPLEPAVQPARNWPDQRRRKTRSRDAILTACRALISTGTFQPSALQVAKQAGVSVRTVFAVFPAVEWMLTAALDEATKRAVLTLILRECLFPPEADCERVVRAVVFGRC